MRKRERVGIQKIFRRDGRNGDDRPNEDGDERIGSKRIVLFKLFKIF